MKYANEDVHLISYPENYSKMFCPLLFIIFINFKMQLNNIFIITVLRVVSFNIFTSTIIVT